MEILVCIGLTWIALAAPQPAQEPARIEIREALVVQGGGRGGRTPVPVDPIAAALVGGTWTAPVEGTTLERNGRETSWQRVSAGEDGAIRHPSLRGGYAHATVESERAQILMLEATGHTMVYVNGAPRVGDIYGYGFVRLPVQLNEGKNELLFHVGRGELRATLSAPPAEVYIAADDPTFPDLLRKDATEVYDAAVLVVNATNQWQRGLRIGMRDDSSPHTIAAIPPLSVHKAHFQFVELSAEGETKQLAVALTRDGSATPIHERAFTLPIVDPKATHKRTFRSNIDDSVQYYGVVPPADGAGEKSRRPGLLLTLHGAGVEGIGQARVYSPKNGLYVIAPTNRRPYGFDWEDWGRRDAIEVLNDAESKFETDPRRVWLTGHSMGGHGTWHLGVTYPGRFAAIAPSAGWVSMFSYAGARRRTTEDPIETLLQRCSNPSDTLSLVQNLARTGVYVLHGDADDNVPVSQARAMREALARFHPDFAYYERPGAGHWWGNECCDWPPLIDFLTRHELPERAKVTRIDFSTFSPSVSAFSSGAVIVEQHRPLELSEIHLDRDPAAGTIDGTTQNVARLSLFLAGFDDTKPIKIELDGQSIEVAATPDRARMAHLLQTEGTWRFADDVQAHLRSIFKGPFRDAFDNRAILVVGTHGSPDENAWSLAKARYDAETFWYRGNGAFRVVTDDQYLAERAQLGFSNIVLYGHSDMNGAWTLLEKSPVRVERGQVRIGERVLAGDDLAGLSITRAAFDEDLEQVVGVVAGTGMKGSRTTDRLPYFTSGVAYPDWIVLGADAWAKGIPAVRAAGFFGNDRTLESGETVIRDGAAP